MKHNRKKLKKHVDTRIRIQLRIFMAIFLAMIIYSIYEVITSVISLQSATLGLVLGIVVGIIAGRISNIYWHQEKNKVVSQIDIIGVIILVGYIAFSIYRNQFFGHWLTGNELSAFSFTFLGGTMFGRVISVGISVKKILLAQGIMKDD